MKANNSNKCKEGNSSTPTKTGDASSEGHSRHVFRLNANDVVCGRGVAICKYPGNIQFRELIKSRKVEYNGSSRHKVKKVVTDEIYQDIHRRKGRFVRKVESAEDLQTLNVPLGTDVWIVVDDSIAFTKIKQALREGIAATAKANVEDTTDVQKSEPIEGSKPTDSSLTDSIVVVVPSTGAQVGSPLSEPQRALTTTGSYQGIQTNVDSNSTACNAQAASLEMNPFKLGQTNLVSRRCGSVKQSEHSQPQLWGHPQRTCASFPFNLEKTDASASPGDSKQAAVMPPSLGPVDSLHDEFNNLRSYEEIQSSGPLPTIDASITSLLLRMGSEDPTLEAATAAQPRQLSDLSFNLGESLRQAAVEAIQEQGEPSAARNPDYQNEQQPWVLGSHSASKVHATQYPIVGSCSIYNTDVSTLRVSKSVTLFGANSKRLEPSLPTALRPPHQQPQGAIHEDCEAQSLGVATACEPRVDLSRETNEKESPKALVSSSESETNRNKRMRHAEAHYSAIVDLLQSSDRSAKQQSSLAPDAFHSFSQHIGFPKIPPRECGPSDADADADAGKFLQVNGAAEWLLESVHKCRRRGRSSPSPSAISDDPADNTSCERSAAKKHKASYR